jgi:hypothetical protein
MLIICVCQGKFLYGSANIHLMKSRKPDFLGLYGTSIYRDLTLYLAGAQDCVCCGYFIMWNTVCFKIVYEL